MKRKDLLLAGMILVLATPGWAQSGDDAIYGRDGAPLAAADKWGAVVVAEVDLNERRIGPYNLGDFHAMVQRHRPIPVVEPVQPLPVSPATQSQGEERCADKEDADKEDADKEDPAAPALKAKGAEVSVSKGVITSVKIPDGTKLSDDEFRQLVRLPHLQMLSISNGLDDARLALLAQLEKLEYLQTNLAQVTDAGLKPLARLKTLRNLKFFHPGKAFSGAGLAHLADMPNLARLTVAGSLAFNDDGLAAVAKLTQLQEFRTWHAGGTLEGVKKLTALKNLKSLHLGQRLTYKPPACPDDATLAVVAEMKSLESLVLDEARLSLPALLQLKQLPQLKKLTLSGIDISRADVDHLRKEMSSVMIDWTEPNPVYRKRIHALFGPR